MAGRADQNKLFSFGFTGKLSGQIGQLNTSTDRFAEIRIQNDNLWRLSVFRRGIPAVMLLNVAGQLVEWPAQAFPAKVEIFVKVIFQFKY